MRLLHYLISNEESEIQKWTNNTDQWTWQYFQFLECRPLERKISIIKPTWSICDLHKLSPQVVKASTFSLYADDTSPTLQSEDISQLNETINDDLTRLDLWMQGNKLPLNVSKS